APATGATAGEHAPRVSRHLARGGGPANTLINVNSPDVTAEAVKGMAAAPQGRHKIGDELVERLDPRGVHYYWIGAMRQEDAGARGTDIAACQAGFISVTPLYLDLTHRAALKKL